MDVSQDYWLKIVLELKLRQSGGDAFQDFFSDVMSNLHGDDFVRVRAFGVLGDKGCDGYLMTTGQVYQCYGALNGGTGKVKTLISKMEKDFLTAKTKLPTILKEWYMVHNFVDGLPIEAVESLERLKASNTEIKFGFIGLEGFGQRISSLSESQVDSLLGPVAKNSDAQGLQLEVLRDLVNSVAIEARSVSTVNSELGPVPADKLDANNLPGHWRSLISGGWQNAHLFAGYFDRHPEHLMGQELADLFNARYRYLKSQDIEPGEIMTGLYEFVTGSGTVSPERQVATQALLAHLFESCDIFENVSARSAV
ncbi:MAG TPA: hypothetical protein DD979_05720 [Gammaproteobacteria bacterium]|nr:hypothetical protein [Gammaproteobacteria bacterium]